jgi:hypothetical protein
MRSLPMLPNQLPGQTPYSSPLPFWLGCQRVYVHCVVTLSLFSLTCAEVLAALAVDCQVGWAPEDIRSLELGFATCCSLVEVVASGLQPQAFVLILGILGLLLVRLDEVLGDAHLRLCQ